MSRCHACGQERGESLAAHLAALGAAVRKEIAELEHKRDNDCILSDIEDEWLNDLQTLVAEAGLMEGEER